jgi:hypothetical protein
MSGQTNGARGRSLYFAPPRRDWCRASREASNVRTQSAKVASRNPLAWGAVIVGVGALGAVVLYGATGWLWLVVHEGLH